jgi:hypothetical protein
MSSVASTRNDDIRKFPGRHYGHGWLPAVIPADARRIRVTDLEIAAVLEDAGADVVDSAPDVEIVFSADELRGDAPLVVVTGGLLPPSRRALPLRAAGRLVTSLRARAHAGAASRALRKRGFTDVEVFRWDVGHRVVLPGLAVLDPSLAERLPRAAVVVGRRTGAAPPALEAILAEASRTGGAPLRPQWVSTRSGLIVAACEGGILRVAIGPARIQIASQDAALVALRETQPPSIVGERVPWILARGRIGLADWSFERYLPGVRPARSFGSALQDECLAFLVALHRLDGSAEGGRSFAELAETVAPVCSPEGAELLRATTKRLGSALADVPRGFGHGDFFAGNLLVDGERLTGVLDWDAGGPGRLPLVDLLHLMLTGSYVGPDHDWGPALLGRLLPASRALRDELVARYCAALGIELDEPAYEALVMAYWLGYAAYQLRTHAHRRTETLWIERNVELVLREVGRSVLVDC